jgi:hypothetical protein
MKNNKQKSEKKKKKKEYTLLSTHPFLPSTISSLSPFLPPFFFQFMTALFSFLEEKNSN